MKDANKIQIGCRRSILYISSVIKSKNFRDAFKATIIIGILVNLYILTNGFVNHDSYSTFTHNYDYLITQGKWFVTPLASLTGSLTLRYFDNLIGIIILGICAGIISKMFDVSEGIASWMIGGIMAAFPSVATAIVGRAFGYFALTALLAVSASALMRSKSKLIQILGIINLIFSIGAYQAYLGFTVSLLVLDCLMTLARNENVKSVILRAIRYATESIIAVLIYYIVLKVRLYMVDMQLDSYKGINNMTQNLRLSKLIRSVHGAWVSVFEFVFEDVLGLQGVHIAWISIVLVVLAVISLIILSICSGAIKNRINMFLEVVIILVVMPLSVNIVGVLSANSTFYYNSIFPFVVIYLMPIIILCSKQNKQYYNERISSGRIATTEAMTVVISFVLSFCWATQDNVFYQKIAYMNKQIETECTILVSRIQGSPGYQTDVPIVLCGEAPYRLFSSGWYLQKFDEKDTDGMALFNSQEEMYAGWLVQNVISGELGINLNYAGLESQYYDYVSKMAVYPDSGSIEMKDGKIFVKLSDNLNKTIE